MRCCYRRQVQRDLLRGDNAGTVAAATVRRHSIARYTPAVKRKSRKFEEARVEGEVECSGGRGRLEAGVGMGGGSAKDASG